MVLNSATYAVGLRPGDVIKEINHIPIENASAYKDTIKSVKGSALLRTNKGYYIVKE
jgi:C-terminal processing protease CtpA/Prc